jgi:hypothetical protein
MKRRKDLGEGTSIIPIQLPNSTKDIRSRGNTTRISSLSDGIINWEQPRHEIKKAKRGGKRFKLIMIKNKSNSQKQPEIKLIVTKVQL